MRNTSIERYAARLGLAVVMPAAHRSYYTDMAGGARGHAYWTFITEELPAVARWHFPLSDARENNFVAGVSMGGYGAFKVALTYPERYAAAASLSGSLDRARLARRVGSMNDERRVEFELIFGDLQELPGSDRDLFHLAARLAKSDSPRPNLYQCCGTEDSLHEHYVRFQELAESLGLELTSEDGPGRHGWGYWDRQIRRVLEWLPVRPAARQV
jgi:S-formylglutathione hydrolase FrmB